MTKLEKRLQKLEERVQPDAEPIVIDVVFVNAKKEHVGGFQITIPIAGSPRHMP